MALPAQLWEASRPSSEGRTPTLRLRHVPCTLGHDSPQKLSGGLVLSRANVPGADEACEKPLKLALIPPRCCQNPCRPLRPPWGPVPTCPVVVYPPCILAAWPVALCPHWGQGQSWAPGDSKFSVLDSGVRSQLQRKSQRKRTGREPHLPNSGGNWNVRRALGSRIRS